MKVQIGGAAAQIELREVADKRRLYLVPSLDPPLGHLGPSSESESEWECAA